MSTNAMGTLFLIVVLSFSIGYIVLMAVLSIGLIKMRKTSLSSIRKAGVQKKTKVSVIIPVRNEAMKVRKCLEHLLAQDYPAECLEVLVSDDFSEDHTIAHVKLFIQQHPEFPLSVITCENLNVQESGKKKALTRAILQASGELIVTTDADSYGGSSWISTMVSAYQNGRFRMLLGPVSFERENKLLDKIQALEQMGLMGTSAASVFLQIPLMCNGANLAYQRNAFFETGGFNRNFQYASGDDIFMMSRIKERFGAQSIGFVMDSEAIVYTGAESSLSGFVNQRMRWVSKSRGYRQKEIIFVAALTWLTNFFLLSGIVIGLFYPYILMLSFVLWVLKISADYPLVALMAKFFRKRELLEYYFPAQAFQLVYVVFIGMAGNLLSYSWKGRKIKA